MSSEYIQILGDEVAYGDKNLLHTQLDLISMITRYEEFERLRKEELVLKVNLKKKIEECHNALDNLDSLIPKTKLGPEGLPIVREEPKKEEPIIMDKKTATLEDEADRIRIKIAMLG